MAPTLLSKDSIIIQKWMPTSAKELSASKFITEHILTRPITGPGDLVLALRAKTGAGKSTVLPPELYKQIYDSPTSSVPRGMIIVTQPRVLTAVDTISKITEFNSFLKRGENLGYSTGSQKLLVRRGILFVTIGTLLRQLKVMEDEWICRRYSVIMIDEVHERSIETDLTLFYLKNLLANNWDNRGCPRVVLMSATFEPGVLLDYFSSNTPQSFIDVKGISFPREIRWTPAVSSNFLNEVSDTIRKIHQEGTADEPPFTDILVFAKGGKDIKDIIAIVEKMNTDQNLIDNAGVMSPIELTRITYGAAGAHYRKLFAPIELIKETAFGKMVPVKRRVFVSTNIAETGVTIDSLKYCIDTGFLFSVQYNPDFDCIVFTTSPVTQGESLQRRGRIGRKAPGVYNAMYPESLFNKLNVSRSPAILVSEVSESVLAAIIKCRDAELDKVENCVKTNSKEFNPTAALDFMTPPSATSLSRSLEKLYLQGFVDAGLDPTPMGMVLGSVTKLRSETVRMLLAGFEAQVSLLDLATVGAFAEIGWRTLFTKRKYQHKFLDLGIPNTRDAYRCLWGADFIEGMWAWYLFIEQMGVCGSRVSCLKSWCRDNNISYDGILQLVSKRDEIIESLIFAGIQVFALHRPNLLEAARKNTETAVFEVLKIKRAIYEGFRTNCATWNRDERKYIVDLTGAPIEFADSPMTKKMLKFSRPKRILTSSVGIFPNPFNRKMYTFHADLIMVLDGLPFDDAGFCTHWP